MKLKYAEKKAYRQKLLKQQCGICALCRKEIPSGQDTLDHDHSTGHCRMVLCRNCNMIEGKVLHWAGRTKSDIQDWLMQLMWYWNQDFSHNMIYPSHKDEIDKEIAKLKKQKKRVKRGSTKAKYQAKIDRLIKLKRKQ